MGNTGGNQGILRVGLVFTHTARATILLEAMQLIVCFLLVGAYVKDFFLLLSPCP